MKLTECVACKLLNRLGLAHIVLCVWVTFLKRKNKSHPETGHQSGRLTCEVASDLLPTVVCLPLSYFDRLTHACGKPAHSPVPSPFCSFRLTPISVSVHTHTGHTHTCTSSPICQLLMGGLQDWQTSWQKNWTLPDQNSNWATGLRRMWEKLPERSWNQSQTRIQILNQNQRQRQRQRQGWMEQGLLGGRNRA